MSIKPNYYNLLGLPEDATQEEIRQAHRSAAREFHPDTRKEAGQTELFMQAQEAFEILTNEKERKAYDEELNARRSANLPVQFNISYSRPELYRVNEPQLIYAMLEFGAPASAATRAAPPINAALVIDRSTSMQGERMDTVKSAAIQLTQNLKENDILSVVTFSDRAEVIVPAGRGIDTGMVESHIRMIHAAGGTEVFQGINAGYRELNRNLHKTSINHIILLTDGRTYGDEEACMQLADNAAGNGVRITGIGIGHEWNDEFLDDLATQTGGSSFYIANASDIEPFLKEKFNGLGQVFGEHTRLIVESDPGVKMRSAFRLHPESNELLIATPLLLGSVPRTSPLTIILEFVVPPLPDDITRINLARGDIILEIPSSPQITYKFPIRLSRRIGKSSEPKMPPRPIFQALSQITLYRMQDRARQEVADGKIEAASMRLQRLATQLFSMGEQKLAETAMVEAERIQQTHMFSAEGEKEIKYGTRELLLPAESGDSE